MSDEIVRSLIELVERYLARANEEFTQRLKQWPVDPEIEEVQEVLGALLARQVTLTTQLALSVPFWNGHVAPLVLRAMADVYISVAWIVQNSVERSRQFILYGLGQAKLQLEHRKVEMGNRPAAPGEDKFIEIMEAWINEQRFTFLTDVNLGNWSGITTRQMAQESGCIDFYNYVYTPFSSCTHSMWNHIAVYNLRACHNPLHFHHKEGVIHDAPIDPDYVLNAARYLQKTFVSFDEAIGTKLEGESAFDILIQGLDKLAAEP